MRDGSHQGGAAPAAPPAFFGRVVQYVRFLRWEEQQALFGPGSPVLPDVTPDELVAWFVAHGHYASKQDLVARLLRDYVVLRRAVP